MTRCKDENQIKSDTSSETLLHYCRMYINLYEIVQKTSYNPASQRRIPKWKFNLDVLDGALSSLGGLDHMKQLYAVDALCLRDFSRGIFKNANTSLTTVNTD